MKNKSKMIYEPPCMDCICVEAESDFMSGSVIKETESKVESQGQEIGSEFDAGTSDTGNAWTEDQWK